MTSFVLDASALIAMLREEPGAKRVAEAIAGARMSVFNYAEVVSYFIYAGMDEHDIDQCSIHFRLSWFQRTRNLRGWPAYCGDRPHRSVYR